MTEQIKYTKIEHIILQQNRAEKEMLAEFENGDYTIENPLVKYNGAYNLSKRIDRFFFIRAAGNAAVWLDNYLIAIDTYSKFIFAYAKITKYVDIFGQLLPTEFEAIEHHHLGYKFYEYDPIGFIDENKNIILYQVYADDMTANSSEYVPRYSGLNTQIAKPIDKTTTGRSPYAR